MAAPADHTITLTNFLLEAREQADAVGLEVRHSDALLTRMINRSWRTLRTKITNAGFDYFLLSSDVSTLPTSAVESGETYSEVAWPTGAAKILGFDVKVNSTWYPLDRGTWAQRRDYQNTAGTISTGNAVSPRVFVVRSLPVEDTDDATTLTAGSIALFPLDTRGNSYRIWYLPTWVDVSSGSNVFFGHDDWFQWCIYDVAMKVFIRDQEELGLIDRVRSLRDELWQDIVRSVQKTIEVQPVKVRLVRRRRRGWVR